MDQVLSEMCIIVPVYNGEATLRACLAALQQAPGPIRKIIVVDDGSEDGSASIASSMGVELVRHTERRGCGAARDTGVRLTNEPIIVFVDADVVIDPAALHRIAAFMFANPEYAAVFGSYDAEPSDPGFISQYRNLLHRIVHHAGKPDAETFWTGLGAVRRLAYYTVDGFRANAPSIPDVLLGLDLTDAGFRVRSDPGLLGKHLKPWTLWSMVTTDVFLRAVPWTEIILCRGRFTNDLNTSWTHRVGVASATLAVMALLLSAYALPLLFLAAVAFFTMLIANAKIFVQFYRERGPWFTLGAVPLHVIHQLCSSVGFAIGSARYYLDKVPKYGFRYSAAIPRVEADYLSLPPPIGCTMITVAADEKDAKAASPCGAS